jgi:hypothetical protein
LLGLTRTHHGLRRDWYHVCGASLCREANVSTLEAVLLATNVAFDAVFGLFVAAMIVLAVVVVTWAVRRDRDARRRYLERRADGSDVIARDPRDDGGRAP